MNNSLRGIVVPFTLVVAVLVFIGFKAVMYIKENQAVREQARTFAVITAPSASESVLIGTVYTIAWNSRTRNNVHVGYRPALVGVETSPTWIALSVANEGRYVWNIPTTMRRGWTQIVLKDAVTGEIVTSADFVVSS